VFDAVLEPMLRWLKTKAGMNNPHRYVLDNIDDWKDVMQQLSLFPDPPVPRKTTFYCMDCGIDTGRIDEFYMVTDEVWQSVTNPIDSTGMLCIGCLEQRLGRTLKPDDFPNCPVNTDHVGFRKSKRLLERLRVRKNDRLS
jgi:hypothetical protein